MVNWLVEDGPFDENLEPLIAEIRRQGMRVEVTKYVPFGGGTYNVYSPNECVIFYGSINLAIQIQREYPWIPGPIATFDNFRFVVYSAYFGKYLLNRNYCMLNYAEFLLRYKEMQVNGKVFVRPDTGTKSFKGQVLSEEDFAYRGDPFDHLNIRPESLVIMSTPKKIDTEWRLVICDKKVIAGSQYAENDLICFKPIDQIPQEPLDFASEVARSTEWQPDRIYCMDICSSGGKCYLLEINSLSCAGLYSCDVGQVVKYASLVAADEYKEMNS